MPDALEQQRHDLTHAIGECILAWSSVEFELTMLYCEALGVRGMSNVRTFDVIVSLQTRAEVCLEAISWRIDQLATNAHINDEAKQGLIAEAKRLHGRLLKRYKARNGVAHSAIHTRPSNKKDIDSPSVAEVISFPTMHKLVTSWASWTSDNMSFDGALDVKQLHERRDSFTALKEELGEFRKKLKALPRTPQEFL